MRCRLKEIRFDGSFGFEVYPFCGGHTPDCTFEAMRFLYMLGHRMTAEAGLQEKKSIQNGAANEPKVHPQLRFLFLRGWQWRERLLTPPHSSDALRLAASASVP